MTRGEFFNEIFTFKQYQNSEYRFGTKKIKNGIAAAEVKVTAAVGMSASLISPNF